MVALVERNELLLSGIYLPLLEETGHMPTEKYAHAPEILEHCQRIGKQYGLYDNALFHTEVKDLTWFRCDGGEMTPDDWTNPITRCLGLRLAGDAIAGEGRVGPRLFLAGLIDGAAPEAFGTITAATPAEGRAVVDRYRAAGVPMPSEPELPAQAPNAVRH